MAYRRPLVLAAGLRSELPNGDQLPISTLQLPKGLIDGLQMRWVGAGAVTVSSGACYIESSGKVVANTADIPLTGLSLAVSSWSHLYAYESGGVLAIEASATAPASPYNGTARSKTGDTSKRYVGSVKTDSSGSINPFKVDSAGVFNYLPGNVPTTVLNNGKATTRTQVDCSSVVPITATLAQINISNSDSTAFVGLGQPEATGATLGIGPQMIGNNFTFQTSDAQKIDYYFTSAPAGGCTISILGFVVAR